jgi:hypothetical protein
LNDSRTVASIPSAMMLLRRSLDKVIITARSLDRAKQAD